MRVEYLTPGLTLEQKLRSRANQFNLVRLLLALAVCFDHAGLIASGMPGSEPLKIFGLTSGYLAVNGFFVLSGILISGSLNSRGVSVGYFLSRILRLYPALLVLAVFSVFIIGPTVSTGQTAFLWSNVQYGLNVLIFGDTMGGPTNFYPDNPLPGEFDSPLWTLRYEMLCYLFAPLVLVTGVLRRPGIMVGLILALGAIIIWLPPSTSGDVSNHVFVSCLRFAFCFGLGVLIWQLRERITGRIWCLVAFSLAFFVSGLIGIGTELFGTLWMASLVLVLGLRLPSKPALETDLSYGIYIWHFPIMQIALGEQVASTWPLILLFALPTSTLVAWLSWTYVEQPALRLKAAISERLSTEKQRI